MGAPWVRPKPHQIEAIQNIVGELERGDASDSRATAVMACGTGKSLVGAWVGQELGARTMAVVVPLLDLVDQMLGEWRRVHPELRWAAICSRAPGACPEDDITVEEAAERLGAGGLVTTDVEAAASWLREQDRTATAGAPAVVFVTYQSAGILAEALTEAHAALDYMVVDEAHHAAVSATSAFSVPARPAGAEEGDPLGIAARRRLFVTATPRIYSTTAMTAAARRGRRDTVYHMGMRSAFGVAAHQLDFAEAIKKGLLSDYDLGFAAYTEEVAELLRADVVRVDGSAKDIPLLRLVEIALVAKSIKRLGLKRIVTFHPTIEEAKSWGEDFSRILPLLPAPWRPDTSTRIGVEHISAHTLREERQKVIATLRELPSALSAVVVTNCYCLAEGVDIPALDAVVICGGRQSVEQLTQIVGRVMRQSDGKERGYVLVPALIKETALDDAEEGLRDGGFRQLVDLLRAMRAQDRRIAKAIDELPKPRPHRSGPSRREPAPPVVLFPGGRKVEDEFTEETGLAAITSPARVGRNVNLTIVGVPGQLDDLVAEEPRLPEGVVRLASPSSPAKTAESTVVRVPDFLATFNATLLSEVQSYREHLFSHVEESVRSKSRLPWPNEFATDGCAVGRFVARTSRSKDQLTADEVARFEGLALWRWESGRKGVWEHIRHIREYRRSNVGLPGPSWKASDGCKTGQWLANLTCESMTREEQVVLAAQGIRPQASK